MIAQQRNVKEVACGKTGFTFMEVWEANVCGFFFCFFCSLGAGLLVKLSQWSLTLQGLILIRF